MARPTANEVLGQKHIDVHLDLALDVKAEFGAKYDGVTDDSPAWASAIAALPSTGGIILSPPGSCRLASTVEFLTNNKRVHVIAYGTKFLPDAGVTAFKVKAGYQQAMYFDGIQVDGRDLATTTAFLIEDSDGVVLRDFRATDCTTGIDFFSNAVNNYVERCAVMNAHIFSCTTGIKFRTGSGTGSFRETKLIDVGLDNCTTGMDVGTNTFLGRSFFDTTIWVPVNGKGLYLDGDFFHVRWFLTMEAGAGTGETGFDLGPNAVFLDRMMMDVEWNPSAFTTPFNNPNGRNFTMFTVDGSDITNKPSLDVYGNSLSIAGQRWFYAPSAANPMIETGFGFAGGGGFVFGPGGATAVDTNLYRSAADILKTDDTLHVEGASGIVFTAGAEDYNIAKSGANLAISETGVANRIVLQKTTGHLIINTDTGQLLFGSGGDTNLYRSAANQLKTDDSLDIADTTGGLKLGGTKVVGAQGAAVADASGGATIDAEARTAINTLLARLRTHGIIAT